MHAKQITSTAPPS